jgi:glycosyltransferase involved in cell wall biosynthesis
LIEGSLRVKKFVYHSSLTPLPKSVGVRLVEQRVSVMGVPVLVRRIQRPKYRVALLVDEFFGGWDTAIGGYGALARKYICKYIPDEQLQIDLLLDIQDSREARSKEIDGTTLYRLPSLPIDRQLWFEKQAYDLFLSIEMTFVSFKILSELLADTPLLYWIQDPRDLKLYQTRSRSVNILRDDDWAYIDEVSTWIQKLMKRNRVSFISQGASLSEIARNLYQIPEHVPIRDLPNPVEIDFEYRLNDPEKENKVIFLGRLEAQKRVWIVCELAKRMPQYQFYVVGATGKGRSEAANAKALEPYRNTDGSSKIKNLTFTGHLDGNLKIHHIKTAKILLNTSIWEGIPVSWLEALSYGTLIVSAFDRDDIVGRFGTFVGEILGDGTDEGSLDPIIKAIDHWMSRDVERNAKAHTAIEFVRQRHSVKEFRAAMCDAIHREIR